MQVVNIKTGLMRISNHANDFIMTMKTFTCRYSTFITFTLRSLLLDEHVIYLGYV